MSNYSGYSFDEILNMPLNAYLMLRRDAWLNSMQTSEEAREVLKRIYQLQQSEADISAIRQVSQYRSEVIE